ncbi:MAG: transcriptional repressor [Pirellulales bacterium]|nr:transcriptional repressor [Pirellulales bacterium]
MFQRNTQQRQVILEELRKVHTHPTAAGLYALVRSRLPKISLGTVYRNLEMLHQSGIIQKLEFGGSEARYDGTVERHDHIRCLHCGRVEDVSSPPLDLPGVEGNDLGGYKILGHRFEYLGLCPGCQSCESETNSGAE